MARFDFAALLRGNSQARADYWSKALGLGGSPAWISVNEVRRAEGQPLFAGDDYDKPATSTNPISHNECGENLGCVLAVIGF